MTGILADKRDYHKGFKKHSHAYTCLNNASIASKRLILVYSVECGLKHLLMKKWGVDNPVKLNNDPTKEKILYSHNLEVILKELGQIGTFKFPHITTTHKEAVTCNTYHQLYRYCIGIESTHYSKENDFEEELVKISNWIKEKA